MAIIRKRNTFRVNSTRAAQLAALGLTPQQQFQPAPSGEFAPLHHTHDASALVTGIINTARLGSGVADATTYLRGDGVWTTVSGSGAATGTAVVDFGAYPGKTDTSVAVTGQAGILSGSVVKAWMVPTATADHSADEHLLLSTQISIVAGNIVAGDGFTIYAIARHLGTEPLEFLGIGRHALQNPTPAQNTSGGRGVFPSVGGRDLSRQYGQFSIAWEWA